MSRFTILLGGDLKPTVSLRSAVSGSRVIAADAGMAHAATLGVHPELWVGDFDSVPENLPAALADVPRLTFPPEKDRTDGELAVECARERGASSLLLAGAFGGPRADHEFLHLALALRCSAAGLPTILTSGDQQGLPLLPGVTAFDYPDGTVFSILAFSDLAGLTVAGAKWPLEAVEVPFGSSLTLSNAVSGRLSVELAEGRALLVAQLGAP